jgi:hypothetical protein
MVDVRALATADPLGLGGLMMDASRIAQLVARGALPGGGELLEPVLAAALVGLVGYAQQRPLQQPASRRLAFRELGLSIGLHAIEVVARETASRAAAFGGPLLETVVRALRAYVPLASAIEAYWLEPVHQATQAWRAQRDIDEVMLATSLLPGGFLEITRAAGGAAGP